MENVFGDAHHLEANLATACMGEGAPSGSSPHASPHPGGGAAYGEPFPGLPGNELYPVADEGGFEVGDDRRSAGRPPGVDSPGRSAALTTGAVPAPMLGGAGGAGALGELDGRAPSLLGCSADQGEGGGDAPAFEPEQWGKEPARFDPYSGRDGGGDPLFGRDLSSPPGCAEAGSMLGNLHLDGRSTERLSTAPPSDPLLAHKPVSLGMEEHMLLARSCSIVSAGSCDGDAQPLLPMAERTVPPPAAPSTLEPTPLVLDDSMVQVVDEEIEVCDDRRQPPRGPELAQYIIDSYQQDKGVLPARPMHSAERALRLMRRNGLVREWLLRGDAGRPSQGALDNAFAMTMHMQFVSSGVGPVPAGDLVNQHSKLLVLPFATVNGITMGSIYGASSDGDYGWDASRSNTRFVYNEATGECLTFSWHGAVVIVSWFHPRDRFTRHRAVFMFLTPRTQDEEPQHLLTHMSFVEHCNCKVCGRESDVCLCPRERPHRSPTSPVDFSGFDMADMLGDFRGHCHTLVYKAESGALRRSTMSGCCLSSAVAVQDETQALKRQTLDQLGLLLSSPLTDISMVSGLVPNYRALAANVISFCYSEDEGDGEAGPAGPKPKRKRGPRSSELTDAQRAMREFTRKERNRHHARVSNEKRRVRQAKTLQRKEMLVAAVAKMHKYLNHYRDVGRRLQEALAEGSMEPEAQPPPALSGDVDGLPLRLTGRVADPMAACVGEKSPASHLLPSEGVPGPGLGLGNPPGLPNGGASGMGELSPPGRPGSSELPPTPVER